MFLVGHDALLGTDLDAIPADDAGIGIQGPGLRVAADLQGVRGATLLAGATEGATVDLDINPAARAFRQFAFHKGIPKSFGPGTEFAENAVDEVYHGLIAPYN